MHVSHQWCCQQAKWKSLGQKPSYCSRSTAYLMEGFGMVRYARNYDNWPTILFWTKFKRWKLQRMPSLLCYAQDSALACISDFPTVWYSSTLVSWCAKLLYTKLSQCWMGRGGTISWPQWSPDLTCLDFFSWQHVKYIIFSLQITSESEMGENAKHVKEGISTQTLQTMRKIEIPELVML